MHITLKTLAPAGPSIHEALDERVLGRLARCDVVPFDIGLLAPPQDRHGGQLSAVVGDDRVRPAAPADDGIHLAHDTKSQPRGVGDQRQALPRVVVDHGQHPEATAVGESVGDEVQAPSGVGAIGNERAYEFPG